MVENNKINKKKNYNKIINSVVFLGIVESNYLDLSVTSYQVVWMLIIWCCIGALCNIFLSIWLFWGIKGQVGKMGQSTSVITGTRPFIDNLKSSYCNKWVGVRNYSTGPGNDKSGSVEKIDNWLKWKLRIMQGITVGSFLWFVKRGYRAVGKTQGGVEIGNKWFNTQLDIVPVSVGISRGVIQDTGGSIIKLQEGGNILVGLASFGALLPVGVILGNVLTIEPLVDVARSSIFDMTPKRIYDSIFNLWRIPFFLGAAHESLRSLITFSLRKFGFGESNLSSYQVSLFRWSLVEDNYPAWFTRRVRLLAPVLGITGLVVGLILGVNGMVEISPELLESMAENSGGEVVENSRDRVGLTVGESSDQGAAQEKFERMCVYKGEDKDFASLREEWLQNSSDSTSPDNNASVKVSTNGNGEGESDSETNNPQNAEEGDEANRSKENYGDRKGKGPAE